MAHKKKKKESPPGLLADNRRARFLYIIEEALECGIELAGTEVKSLKNAHFSFTDAYAEVRDGELWLRNFQITPYMQGGVFNHASDRPRRLLAHKKEILKLGRRVNEKGFTLIPLKFYLSRGYVKVELGVCRGKKLYDKRESIKQRDVDLDMERNYRPKS
ncbi:MAG: SsrA-binding protein [Spirochaeta sp. LUC14_002_19_P3]|nr:MAG: SsrA-binding protein [Spirochaeta sp. LUC14_002_19_P3]